VSVVWPFAGKRGAAVRRASILTLAVVFGLTFFEGTASATPTAGKVMPYVEIGSGTITSTTNDVTASIGTVFGTPVFRGTTSGSQMAASPPPPCGSGSSSVTGSVITTGSNGNQLTTSLNGTVCVLATTSSYTRYLVMNTVTVTGGAGEFANATGSAKQVVVVTLSPTTFGSQGPFTSFTYGSIQLTPTLHEA
jgi:hypothetical protein